MLRRTAGRAGRKDALLKGSRIEAAGRLVIPARTENPEPGPWPGLDTCFRRYDTALLSFPRKAGIHRSLKARWLHTCAGMTRAAVWAGCHGQKFNSYLCKIRNSCYKLRIGGMAARREARGSDCR